MSQPQINFRLCDNQAKRCFTCSNVAFDAEQRAHCMLTQPAGSQPPAQGRRVNENYVCDSFAPK